jgi:hypothetical protein
MNTKNNKKKSLPIGTKEAGVSPFEYVNAINRGENLIKSSYDHTGYYDKYYNAYIANKAFSFHYDTILMANEMNMNHGLDNTLQYDYYMNTIRPRTRRGKWFKAQKNDDLQIICDFFNINKSVGLQYMKILSDHDIIKIKTKGASEHGK